VTFFTFLFLFLAFWVYFLLLGLDPLPVEAAGGNQRQGKAIKGKLGNLMQGRQVKGQKGQAAQKPLSCPLFYT
jgi:hypothetical protein